MTGSQTMSLIKDIRTTFREHRTAFIVLNVAFYGILVLGMIVTMIFPQLKTYASAYYDLHNIEAPILTLGLAGYANGEPVIAAAVTLLVNLSVAVGLTILPSLLIPFIGIIAVFYRVVLWGAMFAPFGFERLIFVPHMPTVIAEGFAYVIAAFAVYVHGIMVAYPQHYGFTNRADAYKAGLIKIAQLMVLVVGILILAAIYEALEVIYWVPRLVAAAMGQ